MGESIAQIQHGKMLILQSFEPCWNEHWNERDGLMKLWTDFALSLPFAFNLYSYQGLLIIVKPAQ